MGKQIALKEDKAGEKEEGKVFFQRFWPVPNALLGIK